MRLVCFVSVQHWRLPVGIYVYFLIGVGRAEHTVLFFFFILFLIFSLVFFKSIFWQPFLALITSAWQSFARRWLSLILIRMPGDKQSFIQNSRRQRELQKLLCQFVSVALCECSSSCCCCCCCLLPQRPRLSSIKFNCDYF